MRPSGDGRIAAAALLAAACAGELAGTDSGAAPYSRVFNTNSLTGANVEGNPLQAIHVAASLGSITVTLSLDANDPTLLCASPTPAVGPTVCGDGLHDVSLTGNVWSLRGTSMVNVPLTLVGSVQIPDPSPPEVSAGQIWAYYLESADGQPVCADAVTGQPTPGLFVANVWNTIASPVGGSQIYDPSLLTFTCPGLGAVAKCLELGYKPYASLDGVKLLHKLQACTRAIRADYCGNGVGHTQPGTPIDLYDITSPVLQPQDPTLGWPFEAFWDESGPTCWSAAVNNCMNRAKDCGPRFGDTLCPNWRPVCDGSSTPDGTRFGTSSANGQ
jgi:hypothetical protein